MSKRKEDSYIFCAALMRASEKNLLPEADLARAAEAKDVQEAMSVLAEFGYGDGRPLAEPRDFIKVLAEEEEKTCELVFSALPEAKELEVLRFPKDYHNAKAILKSEFLGIAPETYFARGGMIEPEKLAAMIKERDLVFLSPAMREGINEAVEVFGKGRDPQDIDVILDKACYKDMLAGAEAVGNDFLIGYVRLLIDVLNINAFVRLKQIGKPLSFFKRLFLEGGNVGEGVFTASYEETFKQSAERFAPYGFREAVEKGASAVEETGKYFVLEKLCDDRRMEYIKDAKYVSFGIEPAAAYMLAKESEIKNLRMILTGKLAGTEKEVIEERLRETYV